MSEQKASDVLIRAAHVLKPLGDKMIVRVDDSPDMSKGGIALPISAQEQQTRGLVVCTGAGERNRDGERIPMDVKTGDVVMFGKYAGSEIKLDGAKFQVIREVEVLCVLHPDE